MVAANLGQGPDGPRVGLLRFEFTNHSNQERAVWNSVLLTNFSTPLLQILEREPALQLVTQSNDRSRTVLVPELPGHAVRYRYDERNPGMIKAHWLVLPTRL